MAFAGTKDVSVAFAGVNRTFLEFTDAVFAADVLVSMQEPLRNAGFERKLARALPGKHGVVALQDYEYIAAKAQLSFVVRA